MVYEAIKMVKAALGNLPSGIQPDQSKAQSTTCKLYDLVLHIGLSLTTLSRGRYW
jgi:hypothetical protein